MPELPEVVAYLESLAPRLVGEPLESVRVRSPSLLRTYDPPVSEVAGRRVTGLRRIGKRIVLALEGDLYAVIHLMIAGRFQWKERGAAVPRKVGHAAFDFPSGTLLLVEPGTQKRASLHVVRGEAALAAFERGGVDPLSVSLDVFGEALVRENRTLKRALTDPRILDGIGNAHSDEILHRASLSPAQRTANLSAEEVERLYEATRAELREWIDIRRAESKGEVPKKLSAFHPSMAVHGRYGEPCPRCGAPVQRIVYAGNETNYCARCQTGGRLLADRAFSRLLREDWPKTLDELEARLES